MNGNRRTYFDNAATSWPKADRVQAAINFYVQDCGAAAGRGSYRSAHRAGEIIDEMRTRLARMLGAESRHCISLHSSGTTALNAAIHGLLRPGDHVVTTVIEHNSVLRPLEFLRKSSPIEVTVVPCDAIGQVAASDVLAAVRPNTRLVAMSQASNVTGAIQPVAAVGDELRNRETMLLCDAAQSFGYVPISVRKMGIDLLAIPGHKGGGGPLGTGALYVESSLQESLQPTIHGGTGFDSDSLEMPSEYPAKIEAGNLNVLGFAGWLAAASAMGEEDEDERLMRMLAIGKRLRDGFASVSGVHLIGDDDCLPVVSIVLDDLAPIDVATILDSDYGIETRAGLHCAALIHPHLGTQGEGTLRISAGLYTCDEDIDTVVSAVSEIAAECQRVR